MLKRIFFFSFLLLFVPACLVNFSGVNTSYHGFPSIGSDTVPADSEYFYIDLDPEAYEANNQKVPLYDINTTEEYDDAETRDSPSNCEIRYIPVAEGEKRRSSETKVCILEIPEWEYIVKDLHITYNFPAGMCEFTTVSLPWHFNYPVYPGPVVRTCEDDPDTENVTESGFYCTAEENPGIPTCDGETCYEQEDDLCPGGPGDPICCYGGEREASGDPWLPERTCFGGPGLIASRFSEKYEFFKWHVQASPEYGFRQTISFRSLLSFTGRVPTSVLHANYLEEWDRAPSDLDNLNRSTFPAFLRQSESTFPYAPRLFFEFACFDGGGEEPHRIFLMIREWNTLEEFKSFYLASGNPDDGDPDIEGAEGRDCDYEDRTTLNDSYASRCNDLLDFDDLLGCDGSIYPALCDYFVQNNEIYPRFPYDSDDTGF